MRLSIIYEVPTPDGCISEVIDVTQTHSLAAGDTVFMRKEGYHFNGIVKKVHHIMEVTGDGSMIHTALVTVLVTIVHLVRKK